MSYKALYRTYRPNSFEEVAGQNHVVRTLQNAVEQNKIAHAYLFCGPRGTGKTSIAKIFAKAINCENETHKPCLECENCIAVQNGSHPDVIEIDAASNNGVEEVRTLIEKVKYAPLKGKYKVYIIDEVHMMSTGAFNALLKTIEEPPTHVIFILATTEPQKVIPTIISRCQRFDFTKVPMNEIIERMYTILKQENIQCDDEVVHLIAHLADGGLRDALSILDQCIAYAKDNIKLHHINEIYGITTVQEKIELFQAIFNNDPVVLLEKIDYLVEKGIDIKRLTENLIELLKESIVFEYTKDAALLHEMSSDEAHLFINYKTIKERFKMIHILMETYDKYRFAANVSSYFEVCMLEMMNINNSTTMKEIDVQTSVQPKEVYSEPVVNVSRETSNIENNENIENHTRSTNKNITKPEVKKDQVEEKASTNASPINTMQPTIKKYDKEYILSLLVGATKPEKISDMQKFERISSYLDDLKWGRYASLLRNGVIVGSGSNYIVFSVNSNAESNEINEAEANSEFHTYIVELLGKSKKIFAISKEQQTTIIQEFKDRMINGTLPEAVQVADTIVEKNETKAQTQEEIVLNLFGEENITIKEK